MKAKLLNTIVFFIITATSVAQTFTIDGLNYEVISSTPNEVKLTGGTPATTDLVIPATVSDGDLTYNVTIIGTQAFGFEEEVRRNVPTITSVSIPNTVREIQSRAFKGNQITGALSIPNSVTTFGSNVFSSNQITSATLPSGLTEIPESLLSFNNITAITIPTGVTIIGNNAFQGNDLTEIILPNGLTSIGEDAFRQNDIATLSIPSTVTTIGASAFQLNPITEVTALGTTAPIMEPSGFNETFTDVSDATLRAESYF